MSTDEVYGSIAQGSWDEARPLEPNSPYSAREGRLDRWRAPMPALSAWTSITRCSNNYGPYQFPEKVIPCS